MVEHSLGKGEVESSILSCSTILLNQVGSTFDGGATSIAIALFSCGGDRATSTPGQGHFRRSINLRDAVLGSSGTVAG